MLATLPMPPATAEVAPRKIGRPTKFTPKLAENMLARIAQGESLNKICKGDDAPNYTTVVRWLNDDESFRKNYAHAKAIGAEKFADEIVDIADDAEGDWITLEDGRRICNHENIARSKLKVDARKWVAAKLLPKKYGDVAPEINVNTGTQVVQLVCDEATRAKLIALREEVARTLPVRAEVVES
jgi:hypothetical protein